MGQHGLVGRDERLTRRKTLAGKGERGAVGAPDQLHHHIYIVAAGQGGHVVHPFIGRQVHAPVLVAVTRGNGDDLNRAASAACDQVCICL